MTATKPDEGATCRQAFITHWSHYEEDGLYSATYDSTAGFSTVQAPVTPSRTVAVDRWGNVLFVWPEEASGEVLAQWVVP